MSAANSNSESGRVRLPVPVPLLPPLTINDNSYSEKKRNNSKKKLLVDIGRSSIDDKEWLILVRDHPRERLARSRVSAEEQEETLLARVAEKQDVRYPHDCPTLSPTSTSTSPSSSSGTNSACTTPCTTTTATTSSAFNHRSSQEEEFYADIYQYYYDVTKPPSPSPSPPAPDITPSPPGRDYLPTSTPRPEHRPRPPVPPPIENPPLAMSKKRGSLQAIFVPSFLQSAISTTTTPPLTPAEASPPSTPGVGGGGGVVPGQGHGTAKYASRIRALSAAGSHSNSRANAGTNANATGTSEPHQRKRSMTFSMSMSLSMASSLHSASASSSFPSNITSLDPSVAPSPSTHAPQTTPSTLSPRSSPPPAFLIDDDPFANLTSAPSESMGLGVGRFHHHAPPQPVAPVVVALPPPPPPIPRSPLHETPLILPSVASAVGMASSSSSLSSSVSSTASDAATVIASGSSSSTTSPVHTTPSLPIASIASITPSSSTSSLSLTSLSKSPSLASLPKSPSLSSSSLSTLSSPKSTPLSVSKTPSLSAPSSPPAPPPQRTRPAHQRPAFSPRPSLPSLDTLARMNIVLTKKVRKGRVGAGLPFEPWDLPSDDECTPPPPPPPNASTSTSSSNSNSNVPAPSSVPTVRPQVASTSASGPSTNTNMNTEAAAGQFSTPNPNSISTNISAPQSVSSSIASSIPALSSSSPPLLPPFSTMVSPTHSPALSRSASPTLVSAPAQPLSRSTSPSASYLQYSASPSTQPSSPTSPTTSTSTRSRSSSSSFTPPATAPTFAAAPTSGYSPHPPPPPPMQMPIARPQPLLPSQILALGSIAADVEMVMPVSGFGYQLQGETGRMAAGAAEGFDYAWTKPAPAPAPGSRLSTYSPGTTIAMMLPVVEETEPGSLDVDFDAEAEGEEPEGYFGDFLDRYQRPSRAGSEDGHGVVHGRGQGEEPSVRDEKEEERVPRPADELVGQRGQAGVNPANVERDSVAEEYSYIYASGKLDNDGIKAEENGDGKKPAGPSSHSGLDMTTRPGSAVFSSPPSSASLSRSFSMRSDSSMGSVDSACALEEVGAEGEVERVLGEEMWSYRRFAGPSRSLSSLELDLEGEGLAEEAQDTSKYDTLSAEEERRRGDSTRSSSSHPSLSRTRSSSDDSDLLHSPTPDDHDYSFFPYSHARTLARIYQSSGYSVLFAPPLVPEEEGPSFHAGAPGDGLSLSSSMEEVGVAEARWGGPFMAEPERGIRMPGGFTADTDGDGGFGFGFDKVIVAAEAQDDVVDVKEKESLTIATSIDVVQPTSAVATEADLPSPSSSDQHDLSLSASSNLSLVEPGISPLVSELDSVAHPTSLISDDELMSRSNMMASGAPTRFRTTTMRPRTSGQANDSTGYRSRGHSSTSSTSQPYRAGSSHGQPSNSIASNSHYHSMESRNNHAGWRRGESEDEDEEENRRRRRALERMYASDNMTKVASHSSSDDDGTNNCGVPSSSSSSKNRLAPRGTAAGYAISRSPSITGSFVTASSRRSPASKPMDFPASSKHSSRYVTEDEREEDESSDDDDDVPLAQRIPGALSAQKTIRRQFREEREQRRREKASRMENGNAERRARQETLRPAGAGVSSPNGNAAVNGSSSHDAAMLAASSVNAQKRQRTTTLPGKSLTSATFNPHDLARKLQNVQLAEVSMPAYQQQQYLLQQQQQQLALRQRSKSVSRTSADHQYPNPPHSASPSTSSPAVRSRSIKDPSTQSHRQFSPTSPPVPQAHVPPVPALRPMRSFRHTSDHRSVGMDDPRSVPLPADAEQRLGRSVTSATRSHRPAAIDDPRAAADGLGRSATSATRNPHRRSPSQSRPSGDRGERLMEPVPPLPTNVHGRTSHDDPRKTSRPNTAEPRSSSSRTSGDGVPRTAAQPLPPLSGKVLVSQQRVFVGNLQQFHMVEIGPSTTAGDVVAMMEAEGALNGWAGSGGWMVFEIAQDFGMERPVRSYELLADVQASWLKDKSVNYFVLKLSPLAIPLSRNAIPTSSPTHSGYIEWEAKRGKWSKRWLQLREHNLYLAKRDNGKDEVLICSLSNFDAYNITRAHRAPKPFAFAIKSTDNLSFFENTADYLHTFSCSEKDGKIWMEKILVARSYVLHQERHILFNPKPASNTAGAAVSRAATKKYAPVRSAQQPLVSLPPIGVAQSLPHHDVFEPGSLLAKH